MDEKNVFDSELDPEIIKVRDKIISKIGDKPLDEVNSIIKKLLNESMDEVTRLGALAARLKIIRSKIDLLYDRKVEIKPQNIKTPPQAKEEKVEETKKKEEKWVRIKMLEAGDVNGKQIDKGVILDVKEDDSKKLIETKKAEIVEEATEGASPIQKSEKEEKVAVKKEDIESKNGDNVKKSNLSQDVSEEKKNVSDDNLDIAENSEETSKSRNLLEKHEDAVSDDEGKNTSASKETPVSNSPSNEKDTSEKAVDVKPNKEIDNNAVDTKDKVADNEKLESQSSPENQEKKEEGNLDNAPSQLESKEKLDSQDSPRNEENVDTENNKESK